MTNSIRIGVICTGAWRNKMTQNQQSCHSPAPSINNAPNRSPKQAKIKLRKPNYKVVSFRFQVNKVNECSRKLRSSCVNYNQGTISLAPVMLYILF